MQRFSEDQPGFAGGDVTPFSYARNAPTRYTDPRRLFVMAMPGSAIEQKGFPVGLDGTCHVNGVQSTRCSSALPIPMMAGAGCAGRAAAVAAGRAAVAAGEAAASAAAARAAASGIPQLADEAAE